MTTAPTKKKYPRADAIAVAKELVALLRPACEPERLVVAGSLRRGKAFVSDVEILFVPSWGAPEKDSVGDLFRPTEPVDKAHEAIEQMLRRGVISKRLAITGKVSSYGPLNKHCVHQASGIPVDLFSTTITKWPMTLLIRTGSAEHNIRLIQSAAKRGLKLHAYGDGFTDKDGNNITAVSEEHIFTILGMKYLPPHARF